jgi:tetratricopeptide (TPR) repeat protein
VATRLAAIASILALVCVGAQTPSRVFVVVFDDQHLSAGGLKRLQTAATSLFINELRPGDLGGVVVDGRLVGDRFYSDRVDLQQAVGRAHPRLATASDLAASSAAPGGIEQSSRLAEIETIDIARAALDRKLSIVEALIPNLARLNGSKAVLLASESFGGDAAATRVANIAEAAKRANVQFHVFDESGDDRDAASGLARLTGGVIVHKSNEFAPALDRIARAAAASAAIPAAPPSPAVPSAPGSLASVPSIAPEATPQPDSAPGVSPLRTDPAPITAGTVVPAPSADPALLRVRPLVETHVNDLARGDWSDANARAGWEAYQRGDLESARASLAPIAARPLAPSWIQYVLGQANYGLGEFKDAEVAWERVRQRQPGFEPVYFDLADNYVKLNERKKAVDVLHEARRRWPKDVDVLNDLGVTQAGAGRLDDAIKVFNDAIALAPKETITYFNLGKALEMRYFEKRRHLEMMGWNTGAAEERDRQKALNTYQRYLDIGGSYGDLAREGIARLKATGPLQRRR